MVKLPPESPMFPGRGVAIKGRFYSYWVGNRLVVAKWPRRQPTPRTKAEGDNRKLLAKAAKFTAYMSAGAQTFARDLAKESKLLPRDFLMIALFNRIGYPVFSDGRKLFSMAAMQDVSNLLDALGQTEGDILYRGETWWQVIAKGLPGQVLMINEDGDYEWVTLGGGGGTGYFNGMTGATDYTGGNTTSAFATKGYVATMQANVTILALNWFVDQASVADNYRGVIADANPATGKIGATVWTTQNAPSFSTDSRAIRAPFATPPELIGGQSYFFGIQNISGSGTTAARVSAAGNGFVANAPMVTDLGLVNFNLNNIVSGNTPVSIIDTVPQTLWYQVWPEGHYT